MSDTQDQLLEEFSAAAGDAGDPVQEAEDLINEAATLTEMVSETREAPSESAYIGAEEYTLSGTARSAGSGSSGSDGKAPPAYNPSDTPAKPNTTGNTGITGLGVAETVLESGMGIVPLALGLMSLFEGSGTEPEVLTKYAMPESIQFTGDTGSSDTEQDGFDQMGMPRGEAVAPDGAASPTNALQGTTTPTNGATPPTTSQPNPLAPTTAQPGDPQWFMDHSASIARAVRSAMLNLSSLNDVVSDL